MLAIIENNWILSIGFVLLIRAITSAACNSIIYCIYYRSCSKYLCHSANSSNNTNGWSYLFLAIKIQKYESQWKWGRKLSTRPSCRINANDIGCSTMLLKMDYTYKWSHILSILKLIGLLKKECFFIYINGSCSIFAFYNVTNGIQFETYHIYIHQVTN